MSMYRTLALAAALCCASATAAGAETIYDQPYLGDPFRGVQTAGVYDLAAQVAAADLIVVGRTTRLVEHKDASGNVDRIEATVDPIEVWKGTKPRGKLDLQWEPSATGLSAGSKHVLLIDFRGGSRVLREMYVHVPPSFDRIRAYGYLDGDRDTTFRVIRALIDPKASRAGLSDALLREVKAGEQRAPTAVRLAIDLGASESIAALTEAVSTRGDVYVDTAPALVRLAGASGIKTVLDSLHIPKGIDRVLETHAFAAIAAAGGATAVPIVSDFGTKHPRFRVSAAFALARLGGPSARKQIEAWLAEPSSAAKERMSNGWTDREPTRAELYREALALIKP
jgi:hypothetical protein